MTSDNSAVDQKLLYKAIAYMLISTVSFTGMNAIVKLLNGFPTFELVFFRSVGTFVLCLFLLLKLGVPVLGNNRKLLLLRALGGAVSMYGFFVSIKLIPFGTAITFRYLAPIFAAIFALWWLREKIKPIQWLFFILSFAGVVLIKGFDMRVNFEGLAYALFAALGTGLVFVVIRKISTRDHPLVIVIYFMFTTMVMGAVFSFFDWRQPVGWEWLILISMGLFGFFGQYFMTLSLQSVPTNSIAPFKYTEAIFAIAVGWIWFGESYTWIGMVGIVLVIAGMILNVLVKT
jgi:drug/metabolite transporter (DMT)-like permease